jgi:hypothetical protein
MGARRRLQTTRLSQVSEPTLPRRLVLAESCVFAALFLWLAASAVLVDIEYYDGLDSICNARYFLGEIGTYVATRGPLFGLLLLVPEAIKESMGMHPLEVRPHHVLFAILHAGYALGCYALATRRLGRTFAVFLAFLAAIPTFIFFSYAPFVSHDIVPGILFLGMLLGVDAYYTRPRRSLWWALVALGAAAVLIKHTYAIFWPIAILAQAALAYTWDRGGRRNARRDRKSPQTENDHARWGRLGSLILGAALSATIAILVLGWALAKTYPDTLFFARAFRQARFLLFDAGVQIEQPAWVYLRNLPAYGLLALVLFPVGAAKSWRESRMQRGLVIAWLLAVASVHLFSLHQVRYMLFVAPVTMCLLVPAARTALSSRRRRAAAVAILLLGVLPLHPYSIAREASKIATDFYRRSQTKWFLEPLREEGVYRSPVYLDWGLLSFLPPGDSELAGDIYHECFHIAPHHLIDLFPYDPDEVGHVDIGRLTSMPLWGPGTAYISATRPPQFNPVTWRGGPATDERDQEQLLFLARRLEMTAAAGTDSAGSPRVGWFVRAGAGPTAPHREDASVEVEIAMTERGEPFSILRSSAFPSRVPASMPMRVQLSSEGSVYPMREIGAGRWAIPVAIPAVPPDTTETQRILLHYFEEVRRHRH